MPEGVGRGGCRGTAAPYMTLTAEPGLIGGVPAAGWTSARPPTRRRCIDQNQQFDFYDGGGLDLAVLGMAECDARGNLNVSRFGRGYPAPAASSTSRRTPGGGVRRHLHRRRLKVRCDGRLKDPQEGAPASSSPHRAGHLQRRLRGARRQARALYVTERCVFGAHAARAGTGEVARASTSSATSWRTWRSRPSSGSRCRWTRACSRPRPWG